MHNAEAPNPHLQGPMGKGDTWAGLWLDLSLVCGGPWSKDLTLYTLT